MVVTLVEKYNPEWPEWFEEIITFLGDRIAEACLRIEHIGSTSIPGMTAKPIIDLVLVIESQDLDKVKVLLAERGYYHRGDLGIAGREAFDLSNDAVKTSLPDHHLYVCAGDNVDLRKVIAFREFLKQSKEYAERLSALKWWLAEKFDNDRQRYIEGKATLCQEITSMALEWGGE